MLQDPTMEQLGTEKELPPPQYHEVVPKYDEKPALDEKSKSSFDDASSQAASEIEVGSPSSKDKSFFIDTTGGGCCISPTPLEINITSLNGSQGYTSTRHTRGSGSCTLSHTQGGTILNTKYKFGPGRPPQVHYHGPYPSPAASASTNASEDVAQPIIVDGKWWSRTVDFTTPDGRTFEWNYAKDKATKSNLIVLSEKHKGGPNGDRDGPALAMLVRNKETRPAGSSKWSAGNGGELRISSEATGAIDEALVVATCLIMLKKEVDRRRSSSAAGGVVVAS